ncbi:hypothetical protein, partial [Salmonella enterica]|uniref:hypothetical protein n=1 Tax=Salmonella enterica TaxID=28901 RepID=UPI0020C5042C
CGKVLAILTFFIMGCFFVVGYFWVICINVGAGNLHTNLVFLLYPGAFFAIYGGFIGHLMGAFFCMSKPANDYFRTV